ncbi:WD40 repeat containing protein [Cryptosporidium felis]|nr:WD40 repeat containing protein [Cryptosporidium felis]
MDKQPRCGLLLEIPYTSPISTISSYMNNVLVGTWDGNFFQVGINDKENAFKMPIDPSYPIRYIRGVKRENSSVSHEGFSTDFELLLGGSYKTRLSLDGGPNTPLVPVEELSFSPDTHHQVIETRSSLAIVKSASDLGHEGEEPEPSGSGITPLFLFSSTINSYLGFQNENGDFQINTGNFYIPDREFVILDYDHLSNQLLAVDRSPDRLDYFSLCSLLILEVPDFTKTLQKSSQDSGGVLQNLAEIPPKYLLNFPYRHPLFVTSKVISSLTLKSSSEYLNRTDQEKVYDYCYRTMFSISDFKKTSLSVFSSMANLSNSKFWGRNFLTILISNHTIIGVEIYYSRKNKHSTKTFSYNRFYIKSPDRNIAAYSTCNHNYLVALTEKNRIFLSNRRGEIVFSINNIVPKKFNFRWVWPVHILVMHTGNIVFSTINGIYHVYCYLLEEKETLQRDGQSYSIQIDQKATMELSCISFSTDQEVRGQVRN